MLSASLILTLFSLNLKYTFMYNNNGKPEVNKKENFCCLLFFTLKLNSVLRFSVNV